MQSDLMTLLKAVLAGRGMSPASPMAMQTQAQPMTAAPMAAPVGGVQAGGPMLPMAGEQQTHGNDGETPNVNPGVADGGDGGGQGGGAGNNQRLSHFEMKMRQIANKGPTAYTNAIEKNLGFRKPTIGYGKADPSTFRTGMTQNLSDVLNGTQPKTY